MLELKNNKIEGKNKEELLNRILSKLNASTDEVYYNIEEEITGTLFKSKKYIINVLLKDDVIEYIKSYLKEVSTLMGLKIEFETQKRENFIKINIISDNNAIIIGKNGKTILALQNLIRQSIKNKTGIKINILLDANEYKEKKQRNIERLAVKLAKDVKKTKVEVKMDCMNSYERRLVHNILTDFKGVTTISEGEEPNRHVVIKPID